MKDMSAEDRRVFYFDVRKINWPLYLEKYALGARQFILKDDPSSLPVARKKLQKYVLSYGMGIKYRQGNALSIILYRGPEVIGSLVSFWWNSFIKEKL